MLLWSQPRVESPRHAVANLMCVECGKLVACTDECVYTWLYPLGIAMINESFCLSGKCMLSALDSNNNYRYYKLLNNLMYKSAVIIMSAEGFENNS